jgi:uncharacterized membrane protein
VILVEFAQREIGPRGVRGTDGEFTVVRVARTLGDYVDVATRSILLYGATDPNVLAALRNLTNRVAEVARTAEDRRRIERLAADIDAVASSIPKEVVA